MRILTIFFCLLTINGAYAEAGKAQPHDAIVTVETSLGDFRVKLLPARAPQTVANFIEYVNASFYNSTVFHRVISGFMIQGGGFDTDFQRKSTRPPLPNEANNGLRNRRGTLAMARTSDPHSATSQFFVNLVDNGFLDFQSESARGWGYAVFGEVIDGMGTVDDIATTPTGNRNGMPNVPLEHIVIQDISPHRVHAHEHEHEHDRRDPAANDAPGSP